MPRSRLTAELEEMRQTFEKTPRQILYTGALFLSLVVFSGCSFFPSDKIPITTTSPVALEHYLKGRDLAEKIRFSEAAEEFQLALAEDSTFALAHLQLAFLQSNTADFFKNLNAAKKQIKNVSKGERLWILAVEAGVNSDATKQRDYFKKIVAIYPKDERAHNLLAGYYFGQQFYDLAIEEYRKAIKIDPEFSAPYNQLGYAYRFLGRYDDARDVFGKYIKLIPNDPNPYDSYAELLLKMGLFEESKESYKKALAIDSHFTASYTGVATNLMLQERHKEARKELDLMRQYARNYRDRRLVFYETAIIRLDEGKPELALLQFDESIALAESAKDVAGVANDMITQGYILSEEGDQDKARINFRRAITLVSNSSLSKQLRTNAKRSFLFNATLADIADGELTTARSFAAKYSNQVEVLQSPSLTRTAHQLNGMIALAQGEYETTIKELEKADKQNPYNLFRLAIAYLRSGDSTSARKLAGESAHFNQVSSLPYALVRRKALRLSNELSSK